MYYMKLEPRRSRAILKWASTLILAQAVSTLEVSAAGVTATGVTISSLTTTTTAPLGIWKRGSGTAADQRLEQMLGGDGERLDLAAVNWLLAADIPEFAGWTHETSSQKLNEMTRHVRDEMARMQSVAVARGERLEDARTR